MNTIFYSFTIGTLLLIMFAILFYFQRNVQKSQMKKVLSIDLILMIFTCLFVLLQMVTINNTTLNVFTYIYYVGIILFPVSIYFTARIFIKSNIKFSPKYILLFIIPVISIFGLLSNSKFELFFKNYSLNLNMTEFGILFIINEIYATLLYFIALLNVVKYLYKNKELFSRELKILIVGIIIPFIFNILGILGIIDLTIYITPIALSISTILFVIVFLRFGAYDILPISYSRILNAMPTGYIVINEHENILENNKKFIEIFAIENENPKLYSLKELLKLNNFKCDIDLYKKLIDNIKCDTSFNCYFQKIDKTLNIKVNAIKSNEKKVGTLITFNELEKRNATSNNESNINNSIKDENLNKELLQSITHNLKSPIFSISSVTKALTDLTNDCRKSIKNDTIDKNEILDYTNSINELVEKLDNYNSYMSEIISNVNDNLSDSNALQTFSIDELMENVNDLIKDKLINASIALNISYNLDENISLTENKNTLIQILINIIDNAIDASKDASNKSIDINIKKDKNLLMFSIKDHGKGIPDEIKNSILKETITTKPNGTGIGLFISYVNIKNEFNGDITFKTEKNVGTTFIITIPL